ncbi:MAG: hypothetical protein A2Y40_04625 [Candidatus Margulisbacteria bacterium GWF2_35_9]|nr:MAG: hypothetical protein A2Y40_04625 [Candidatus Margulisbacteria bacterium GWF2_35_9]
MTIAVVGCGAWGTVISQLIAKNTEAVTLFCHDETIVHEINTNHTNTLYLPKEPILNPNIQARHLSELPALIPEYNVIFIVVASSYYRDILSHIKAVLSYDQIIVAATKGMEEQSLKSVYDISIDVFSKEVCDNQFAILSGPNLAGEIYLGKPAATVIASKNAYLAEKVQKLISSDRFRAYVSDDVSGVSYGGILKNIIAIAAGILDAMELGSNAKAALLVRGMAEIKRYAVHFGAKEETLMGLAGFGDLVTTCLGPDSRNYSTGYRIGKGEPLIDITSSMVSVAEGVKACKVVYDIAKKEAIPMPITEGVYKVLYKNANVLEVTSLLMTRQLKKED